MGVSGAAWASECVKSGMARFPPGACALPHPEASSAGRSAVVAAPAQTGQRVRGGSDHMRRFSSAIFSEFQVCAGPGAKEPTARPDEISHSTVCRTSL